ncbi:hypothetical protein Q8791_30500 [Nocardiopsis sp. CT-R113]|uniref:Acetone carboxylase n=1 Tax=Nocardiopsis codii TaxID=3065942 RepID=A0ABU7KH35_9ACTN|nr:hypothetical protein [Nocardiopsis sp. CT-R113]MEE2041561.1 hypothetical protein [Nocardiopsis sp. CT-R113]
MSYIKHRPEVGLGRREDTPEGEALIWRVRCACGTTAEAAHYRYADAAAAVEEHRLAAAPPPGKRCREPKKHRVAWHDWCPLCANQLTLPGFEDLMATTPTRTDLTKERA